MAQPTQTQVRVSSARMFELLMDWFPDVIQSVDPDGHIVYANRKASELLGYEREKILGMHLKELYAPEIWDKVQSGFKDLQSRGSLSVGESLVCDKAGNKIPVEIRSFAVYDENGEFVRTFSILRDIREVKELQNSLLHASRLAAIGELSACVAHDITNPLAVIKLYGELIQAQMGELEAQNPELAAGLTESMASIGKSVQKIEKLVNHLREFSRSHDAQMERVDLRGVIADALFMVTNKVDRGGVKVVTMITDGPCEVMGHGNQLEQVFMNLFSNAADAMREQPQRELRIEIRKNAKGDSWDARVSDIGPGIPQDVKQQMFTPFFTTKPKGQGTGLGLSITRNIIRRHGGSMSFDSEIGKGTTFLVQLPVYAAQPAAAPVAEGQA